MKNKLAILCAGQGAQTVGMGRDLSDAFPECRALFAKANEVLGYDLEKIIFDGLETELVKSNHCQPAIFTVTSACFAALKNQLPGLKCRDSVCQRLSDSEKDGAPTNGGPTENVDIPIHQIKAAAGLSLGEWSALCLADSISFDDGLRVLEARGRYMQEACKEHEGAMMSVIGLESEKLQKIAAETGVEIANYNSSEQTVLSGRKQNILEAEKMVKASGAKRTVPLNVAGAYHSSLMKSAGDKMEALLSKIQINAVKFPVMSNVTGQPHSSPEEIKQNMVRQVTSPVRWVDCVQSLEKLGVNCYVECGPGRVLSGLVKRIQPQARLCNVQDCQSLNAAIDLLISG